MEPLSDVQVWWLKVDALAQQESDRLHAMLDAGEQTRAGCFRHPARRLAFIAAHALVRGLLSSRTGLSPQQWRLTAEPGGRPEVEARVGPPQLRVSLSHTRGLAIAAVAEDHAVGIDAEWLGRKRSFDWFLSSFCAPIERRQLAETPEAYRVRTAVTLWTLKEAYGKATGRGLSYPLASHGFCLTPPALAEAPEGGGAGWLFHTLSLTPVHVAALAIHHGRTRAPSVSIWPVDLTAMESFPGEGMFRQKKRFSSKDRVVDPPKKPWRSSKVQMFRRQYSVEL